MKILNISRLIKKIEMTNKLIYEIHKTKINLCFLLKIINRATMKKKKLIIRIKKKYRKNWKNREVRVNHLENKMIKVLN